MDYKKMYEDLQKENQKLKEKYTRIRIKNCKRMEELVKALQPFKKNYEDHKRILESIVELKQENENLKKVNFEYLKLTEKHHYLKHHLFLFLQTRCIQPLQEFRRLFG